VASEYCRGSRGPHRGDLVVRTRLLIRANGPVSGKITYSEIEMSNGRELSGEIEV